MSEKNHASGKTEIPVSFHIPGDARESVFGGESTFARENEIVWELFVEAPVAGPNFTAWFPVPVFRPDGNRDCSKEGKTEEDRVHTRKGEKHEAEGFRVRRNEDGELVYMSFPPQSVGAEILLLVMFIIFGGFLIIALIAEGNNWKASVARLFLTGLNLFLINTMFWFWFARVDVRLTDHGLETEKTFVGRTSTTRYRPGDVGQVRAVPAWQSGENVNFRIHLDRSNGWQTQTIFRDVPSRTATGFVEKWEDHLQTIGQLDRVDFQVILRTVKNDMNKASGVRSVTR